MFWFMVLRIFGGNRKSVKKEGKLCKHRLLRHSVGNPSRSIALHRSVEFRHRGEPFGTPLGMLHRGVDTIHNEHIFEFCF